VLAAGKRPRLEVRWFSPPEKLLSSGKRPPGDNQLRTIDGDVPDEGRLREPLEHLPVGIEAVKAPPLFGNPPEGVLATRKVLERCRAFDLTGFSGKKVEAVEVPLSIHGNKRPLKPAGSNGEHFLRSGWK
jgi:hypothetical protein